MVTQYPDYNEYIDIVAGRMASVHQPFAGRILAPEIARLVVVATGWAPAPVLGAISAVGWALVPVLGAAYLWLRKLPLGWAIVIATVPFPALSARFILVPDAWAICLVLSIFIALEMRKGAVAGALAFVLAFVRTSSILAVTLQFAADFRKTGLRMAAIIAAMFVVGVLIKMPLIHGNAGNQHQMSSVIYMIAKTPVNGMANIFGVHLYTNTYPYCIRPVWSTDIGQIRGLGNIHTVGVCPIEYQPVIVSLLCYASIFGLLPSIAAVRLFRMGFPRSMLTDIAARELAVFLAAVLLSPAFGLTITRLFVESYPLLFVAAGPIASGTVLTPRQLLAMVAFNLGALVLLAYVAPN